MMGILRGEVSVAASLTRLPFFCWQYLMEDLERMYVNAHYRLKDRFDAGSHGEVWMATRAATASRFVLKRLFLELGEDMVQMGLREAHFGALLDGEPHVTRFVEYFFRPQLTSSKASSSESESTPVGLRHTGPRDEHEHVEEDDIDPDDNNQDTNTAHTHSGHHGKPLDDSDAQTPELWLVFYDEGISLRHYLYEKQETYTTTTSADSNAGVSGVILQRSRLWEKMRADAKGELVLREIMRQLLEGVAALHARGITHRDIKPSNILLAFPTAAKSTNTSVPLVKIADFGSAVDEYTARHLYPPGKGPTQAEETREYQPPEVLFNSDGWPYDYEYPLAYDMWSVGVVFLEMMLGSPQVFLISSRAQAKVDAELQRRGRRPHNGRGGKQHTNSPPTADAEEGDARRAKAYLLHVLTQEFCIFQPPPHQLRSLWDKYALVSESCHFGNFNETVVARDPLHKGLELPFALDLMWKLLQWAPRDRISAREALKHAFFHGPYVCAHTGRKFATEKELRVHEQYLRAQLTRENALAFVVRERVPLPGDGDEAGHGYACPQCQRSFATIASCEQHMHARRHFGDNDSRFCAFDARHVLDAVRRETRDSDTRAFIDGDVIGEKKETASSTETSLDVGMALFQGRKKYMEDFVLVQRAPSLIGASFDEGAADKQGDAVVFAVSDGHLGAGAATFVLEHLVEALTRHFNAIPAAKSVATEDAGANSSASPEIGRLLDAKTVSRSDRERAEKMAMRQTFLELHDRFLAHSAAEDRDEDEEDDDALFSGCTLTVAVLFPSARRLVTANVGDSRAIAWAQASPSSSSTDHHNEYTVTALSMDHWPDVPSERARIESSGGFVRFQGLWRVVGQLAVSRSIGDRHLRRFVTAEPSVFHLDLSDAKDDVLLVLASDGLWESLSSEQVARFLHEKAQTKEHTLNALAADLVTQSYVRGGLDNAAVLLVRLP